MRSAIPARSHPRQGRWPTSYPPEPLLERLETGAVIAGKGDDKNTRAETLLTAVARARIVFWLN
jgi:hypothetical protein